MLIVFDPDVNDLTGAIPHDMEMLFSEILRASELASHKVIIGRSAATWAIGNLALAARHKALLTSKMQSYTQEGGLRTRARCRLEILIGAQPPERLADGLFTVGHARILTGNFLAPAVVLVENAESDGAFFDVVFRAICRDQEVSNYHFEKRNGGGSTITPEFAAIMAQRRVIVCVVDSDRVTPNAAASATFKALTKLRDETGFVGDVLETRCLELENHLPLSLIEAHCLCPSYKDWAKLKAIMKRQGQAPVGDCLWLRFDLKDGAFAANLTKKALTAESLDWIKSKFLEDGHPFESLSIDGFGSEVISQFLKSGPAIVEFRKFVKSKYWTDNFSDFFSTIYWYLIADTRRAAY